MKTISRFFYFIVMTIALFVVGCSTTNSGSSPKTSDAFDGVVRPEKEQIDIFVNGQLPLKPYKAIKIFSEKGATGKEAKMADIFVKKAKALGADAVIINSTQYGGIDVGPVNANSLSVYSATAIVYEQ